MVLEPDSCSNFEVPPFFRRRKIGGTLFRRSNTRTHCRRLLYTESFNHLFSTYGFVSGTYPSPSFGKVIRPVLGLLFIIEKLPKASQ